MNIYPFYDISYLDVILKNINYPIKKFGSYTISSIFKNINQSHINHPTCSTQNRFLFRAIVHWFQT